MNIKDIT